MDQDNRLELSAVWATARRAAQQKWTRLTDADLERIDGDAEMLADCLRQRYGFSTERATQEAFDFETSTQPRSADPRAVGPARARAG